MGVVQVRLVGDSREDLAEAIHRLRLATGSPEDAYLDKLPIVIRDRPGRRGDWLAYGRLRLERRSRA